MTLHEFSDWLGASPLSILFRDWNRILIPSVQTVHIIAVTIVVGAFFVVGTHLLGLTARNQTNRSIANRFMPWIWWAFIVLFISGSILVIAEPERSVENSSFQIKMFMLMCLAAIGVGFQWPLAKNENYWRENSVRRSLMSVTGFLCLALVAGIVLAGRWIAYTIVF